MTISTMAVYDKRYCLEEFLFASTELESERTEVVNGVFWEFFVAPEGTELYSVWESDFYEASYSYVVYKYNWETEDWEIIDYGYADYEEEGRVARMTECCEDAKIELRRKGMIQTC